MESLVVDFNYSTGVIFCKIGDVNAVGDCSQIVMWIINFAIQRSNISSYIYASCITWDASTDLDNAKYSGINVGSSNVAI